jgi:DNA-binding NarL/FixJ family response regulator
LIAHADPLARAYVRGVAESQLRLEHTVEADSFESLLARLRDEPEIALLVVDLDLLGRSWEIALRYIGLEHRGVRVAVLSESNDHEILSNESVGGGTAVIHKQLPEAALAEALEHILGKSNDHADSATHPAQTGHRAQGQLTKRQRDVIRLLSEGRSNREISKILGIAEGTVKVHVNAAFQVLGVHNRVGATVAFRENPGR